MQEMRMEIGTELLKEQEEDERKKRRAVEEAKR